MTKLLQLQQKVDELVSERTGEIIAGAFQELKRIHCKRAYESGCDCEYCKTVVPYTHLRILEHHYKKHIRDQSDYIAPASVIQAAKSATGSHPYPHIIRERLTELKLRIKQLKNKT